MIKVVFRDIYGGTANVLIEFNEDLGDMLEAIDDFVVVIGDQLSDASAESAARKFVIYAKRVGYPIDLNSRESAPRTVYLDLASGSVFPHVERGEMLHTPRPNSIQMVDDDNLITRREAERVGNSVGINWDEVDLDEFHAGMATEHKEHGHLYDSNVKTSANIALDHLEEDPDYYLGGS